MATRIGSVRSTTTRSRATGNSDPALAWHGADGAAIAAPYSDPTSRQVALSAQKLHQALRVDRLREMVIKTGGSGAGLVAVLPPARDGDQLDPRGGVSFANFLCDFIAVHCRHADIEQHELRIETHNSRQRLRSIVRTTTSWPSMRNSMARLSEESWLSSAIRTRRLTRSPLSGGTPSPA